LAGRPTRGAHEPRSTRPMAARTLAASSKSPRRWRSANSRRSSRTLRSLRLSVGGTIIGPRLCPPCGVKPKRRDREYRRRFGRPPRAREAGDSGCASEDPARSARQRQDRETLREVEDTGGEAAQERQKPRGSPLWLSVSASRPPKEKGPKRLECRLGPHCAGKGRSAVLDGSTP